MTQDEVLLGVLTVRETILYAARLRLPTSANPAAVADAVVAELGLVDAVRASQTTELFRSKNSFRTSFPGQLHHRHVVSARRVRRPAAPRRHRMRACPVAEHYLSR